MTITTRTLPKVLVQTAADWGDWESDAFMHAPCASEGAGQVVGDALLVVQCGTYIPAGEVASVTVEPRNIVGRYVRIIVADEGGDVTVAYLDEGSNEASITGYAVWHGVVRASTLQHQGGPQVTQTISCAGIEAVLAGIICGDGWCVRTDASGSGPSNLWVTHRLPPFNRIKGSDRRDGKAIVYGADVEAYVHDLTASEDNGGWTAADILELITKTLVNGGSFPDFTPTTPLTWEISDPTGCLDYTITDLELNGRTALDVLNILINPRRGLTWWKTVADDVVTIHVGSTVASAIGSIPAAPTPVEITPDATWGVDLSLRSDDNQVDIIEVVGDRPVLGMTLAYDPTDEDCALVKGWDGTEDESNPYWMRRFLLNPAWTGNQLGSSEVGIRHLLDSSVGQMSGQRTYDASVSPQPEALELTECPKGTALIDAQGGIVVVLEDGSLRACVTDAADKTTRKMSVTLENDPPAIVIGSSADDQWYLNEWLRNAGARLLVTVGVREPAPLRLRWARAAGNWPRDIPRQRTAVVPELQQEIILAGTVTGVDGSSLTTDVGTTIRDDQDRADEMLDRLIAAYCYAGAELQWTERGIISATGDNHPGRLVSGVVLSHGTEPVGAVITRRAWTFAPLDQVGTTWSTERILPDIDSVL
jgi:hypothetical protein